MNRHPDVGSDGRAVRKTVVSELKIAVGATDVVSGILQIPDQAVACYVMAHGAGAGMRHHFMSAVADGLAARGIASLRYQFPFMERGAKRPDRAGLARSAVSAAVDAAAGLVPTLPLFAGGKSFGGRMTSQAQASLLLPRVRGLVFFGFPLHPAGKPSTDRAEHLAKVTVPMLFLQGTRDTLADMKLLEPLVETLSKTSLVVVEDADHSFHVPARSGRTDQQVLDTMLDAVSAWTTTANLY